ncbi:hypothetical protein [Pseudoalteromonas luteoviolacea]|uniref:Uncharacterized protein n=1 Tax=Pseudoalteromonas luteoviolacea S4060-1 TaxID=1365257 RepID=A0A162BLT2_9GAMM|nr:hypothetical protein [Pseudoalteromonas luteoviolacea]KZN64078.1 hypothetical protein N478_22635 [Pseudoalteromonas luteoviolacea S4060-1]
MKLTMKKKSIKKLTATPSLNVDKTIHIAAGAAPVVFKDFSSGPYTCKTQ